MSQHSEFFTSATTFKVLRAELDKLYLKIESLQYENALLLKTEGEGREQDQEEKNCKTMQKPFWSTSDFTDPRKSRTLSTI